MEPASLSPQHPLDPRIVGVWRRTWWLATGAAVVVLTGAAVAVLAAGATGVGLAVAAAAVLVGVAGGTWGVVWPARRYAWFRWAVLDDGVVVRRGWLWRRLQIVPHSRIQAVDARSGPLERRAGLASVHLRTASPQGSPRIPGLDATRARTLAEHIAERAGADDAT